MTVEQILYKARSDALNGVSLMDGDPGIHSQAYYEAYMMAGGWA